MNQLIEPEGYELFRHWNLYERVVLFNHMRHREIAAALRIAVLRLPPPLRVLDLGAGAGELAFDGLKQAAVSEYIGIDLSADAVRQLQSKHPPGTLGEAAELKGICGEMLEELQNLSSGQFDLVLASYSLHHFKHAEKPPVLAEVARVLKQGGMFIWIDLVCQANESREDYLKRSCERIRSEWNSLSLKEKEETCLHASTCDFPEQAEVMQQLVASLPLTAGQNIYRDELYGGWSYRKT